MLDGEPPAGRRNQSNVSDLIPQNLRDKWEKKKQKRQEEEDKKLIEKGEEPSMADRPLTSARPGRKGVRIYDDQ